MLRRTLGMQRRDALKRLLELARAEHSALKKIAAGNITKFFKDFPELDEDAINAIYDLCEDQDPKVRLLFLCFFPRGAPK